MGFILDWLIDASDALEAKLSGQTVDEVREDQDRRRHTDANGHDTRYPQNPADPD